MDPGDLEDYDYHRKAGLTEEEIHSILRYLDLPLSPTLPSPPLDFLAEHFNTLPTPLLKLFSAVTTPRQRTSLQGVRARRLIYASRIPLPTELSASSGRLRWPLLWERMGGSAVVSAPSAVMQEEEAWVKEHFPMGSEGRQHVKKLGGFMRGLQEERDFEQMARAKRAERKLDQEGEEFDEESDEDENEEEDRELGPEEAALARRRRAVALANAGGEDQREVEIAFERKILELFLDGKDTISYDDIDFVDPPEGDPIGIRDAEDRYFDNESPSLDTSTTSSLAKDPETNHKASTVPVEDWTSSSNRGMSLQNGQGDYDY